jgi:thymidylate kinase
MSDTTLIVFEGIDNSGKTSISQGVFDLLLKEQPGSWIWTKEPDFSTEEADRLNDPTKPMNEVEREILFLESRLRQMPKYQSSNVILDRYLWTGMAYAKVFSPSTFPFVSKLYQSHNIFKIPTLTIFVDTPVEVCQSREPALSLERLNKIRDAYMDTRANITGRIEVMDGVGDLASNVEKAYNFVKRFV